MKQWQHHTISHRRAHLAWASHTFAQKLERNLTWTRIWCILHQTTTKPRLSELPSPKREYLLLKHQNPSPGREVALKHAHVSLRPRLDEHVSPERENKSLKTKQVAWGRCSTPKPVAKPYNSRIGESDLLGWELQYSSPGLARKQSTTNTKTQINHY